MSESTKLSALDPDICYVFCNGMGGAGVDIFFALHGVRSEDAVSGKHKYVLLLDQRKKDNRRLTTKSLRNISEKMTAVAPKMVDTAIVTLVCSAISNIGKRRVEFPPNCIAMTRDKLVKFHGPLSSCASAFSKTNLNTVNVSTIKQVLDCSDKIARAVHARAKERPVVSFGDLQQFLHGKFSIREEVRPFLLLIDDYDDCNGSET
jgi:hypothetical protein